MRRFFTLRSLGSSIFEFDRVTLQYLSFVRECALLLVLLLCACVCLVVRWLQRQQQRFGVLAGFLYCSTSEKLFMVYVGGGVDAVFFTFA